jgi:hypothetical protein
MKEAAMPAFTPTRMLGEQHLWRHRVMVAAQQRGIAFALWWHAGCWRDTTPVRAHVLLFALGCGSPAAPRVPAEVLPYDADFVASSRRLEATLARDGILLDTVPVLRTCDEPMPGVECARCDVATVLDGVEFYLIDDMAIAFARYPTSFRKAARLEHVAFCRAITYEGSTDHGPAGLADPNKNRVYISVEYFRGQGRGLSIEAAVHHEVFHLLDFAQLGAGRRDDAEWHKLNPKGFAYRDPSTDIARPVGFVNGYATTNEVEDRASTFEYLMVRPDELCAIAATDPAVARKARLLWQRVSRIEGADRLGIKASCVTRPVGAAKAKPTKPAAKRRPKSKQPIRLQLDELDDSRER